MSTVDCSTAVRDPQITILLARTDSIYHPGDILSGSFRILDVESDQIQAVETSVLWHTEGKGDEDMRVIYFSNVSRQQEDWINPRQPGVFETKLPNSPISYSGQILSVKWCVRVRLFLVSGSEILSERGFKIL